MTLANRLDAIANCGSISFLSEGARFEFGALLDRGRSFPTWLERHGGVSCAMALSNSAASVSCLLGAMTYGAEVLSIPLPPRGASPDWYREFIVTVCQAAGCGALLVDEYLLSAVPPLDSIEVSSYERVAPSTDGPKRAPGSTNLSGRGFSLIQFTSGSTANPKGVVLGEAELVANVDAILSCVAPSPGDVACSWLPLSHDMGLIGIFLSSLLGCAGDARGAVLCLMTPEHFLRRPADWLAACSEHGATITASPAFGLGIAIKRRPSSTIDLSRIQMCITGAEPIRAEMLRTFETAFGAYGLRRDALAPAYGLAEAGLAVTMTSRGDRWRSVRIDGEELGRRNLRMSDTGIEVVSAGQTLPGYDVLASGSSISQLRIKGPSVSGRHLGSDMLEVDDAGWLQTNDLGFFDGSLLYPVGRTDDVILVAGRNLFSVDIEAAIGSIPGIRQGRIAAVVDSNGSFLIVGELSKEARADRSTLRRLSAEIRRSVVHRVGVGPDQVHLVAPGRLPMTASGKLRRSMIADTIGVSETLGGEYAD